MNSMAAGLFKRHDVVIRRRRKNTLAGLNLPVARVDHAHRGGDRTLHTCHQINPLANARVLLEKARVHQVHAAGVGDVVINHHHLAVLTQIHAAQEDTHQVHLQRFHYLYARIAHHRDPRTAEVGHAAR